MNTVIRNSEGKITHVWRDNLQLFITSEAQEILIGSSIDSHDIFSYLNSEKLNALDVLNDLVNYSGLQNSEKLKYNILVYFGAIKDNPITIKGYLEL